MLRARERPLFQATEPLVEENDAVEVSFSEGMTFRCHTPLVSWVQRVTTHRTTGLQDSPQYSGQLLKFLDAMKTTQQIVSSPIPVASPQPVSRRKALPSQSLLSAHALAGLKQNGFHLDISGHTPELKSSDEKIRVPLDALSSTQLQAVKNLAHDQYVRAMLEESPELNTHRATLNFLSRHLQKTAQKPATQLPAESRSNRRPVRSSTASRRSRTTSAQAA